MHLFQQLLEGVFCIKVATLGRFSLSIWASSREIQAFALGSWSLHWRTCFSRAALGKATIERRKESFYWEVRSAIYIYGGASK